MHRRTATSWLDRTIRVLAAGIAAVILGLAAALAMLDARSGENGELIGNVGRKLLAGLNLL